MYENQKGFTILELIIVITLMSILLLMGTSLYKNTIDNYSKTNTVNQTKSVLDLAASSSRVNIKEMKIDFGTNDIKLIQMAKIGEEWQYEKTLETVKLNTRVTTSGETEVIYGTDGFPKQNYTLTISNDGFNIQVDIYTDGRILIS